MYTTGKEQAMKELPLLVWLTQTGLSIAGPLVGYIFLAIWLRDTLGLGAWVLWVGILLGVVGAVNGLRDAMKTLERLSRKDQKSDPPPVSFNDHD
jgi:hypothetical protein